MSEVLLVVWILSAQSMWLSGFAIGMKAEEWLSKHPSTPDEVTR